MIFLILAIISSALISVLMRFSSDKVQGQLGMLAMNYAACVVLATGYLLLGSGSLPGGRTLALGSLNGVLYLGSFMLFQGNVRKNGVVLSAIFMKLGLMVPMVLSIALFGEMPGWLQAIGFVLAVVAILLINFEKGSGSLGPGLILLLLAGGAADGMSKVFEEWGDPGQGDPFLLYTFGVALILCLALTLWKREHLGKREVLYGLLLGVPNFFSAKFLLASLKTVPAVVAYPTFSVGTILTVTLVGVLFFKERLKPRQWIGVAVILVALLLLNV